MLPYLDQHPNLVVLRTMSKSYSLAGARLGLLFAAAPLVEALTKVKDSYNVNAHHARRSASPRWRIAATTTTASAGRSTQRARLEAALGDLGLTWPESAANFLLVEIGERAEEIYLALKQQGLLVRWWRPPSCAPSSASASASPTTTTA